MGRSIDYAGKMFLSTGDTLYSNRSTAFLTIVHDEVGRHDFTLTQCSREMFRKHFLRKNGRIKGVREAWKWLWPRTE